MTTPTTLTGSPGDWFSVRTAEDADAIRELIETVHDGWFSEGRIDWHDFLDRLDGSFSPRGRVDLGDDMESPAVRRIQAIVRELRRG